MELHFFFSVYCLIVFIFLPSFVKIFQKVVVFLSGHDFYNKIFNGALFRQKYRSSNGTCFFFFCTLSDCALYLYDNS